MMRIAVAVLIVSLVGLAYHAWGQEMPVAGPMVNMRHYKCVYQKECGLVSQVCWCGSHQWASSYCTYCDGAQKQDLCERSDGGSCPYIGKNQTCGSMYAGTCSCAGALGTCAGSTFLSYTCKVPMCK